MNSNKQYRCLCGKQYKYRQGLHKHKKKCDFIDKYKNTFIVEEDHNLTRNDPDIDITSRHNIPYNYQQEYGNIHSNNQSHLSSGSGVSGSGVSGFVYNSHSVQIPSHDYVERRENETFIEMVKCMKDKDTDMKEMFMEMVKQNKELQTMIKEQNHRIIELAKDRKTITNINTQNNFSIINYLNHECKDAVNLSDFVDKMNIGFEDLLRLKDDGIIQNFRMTFLKQLHDMEQTKRPIHCSDRKRKSFYVRENDTWNKDTENEHITQAIKKITNKQCETLQLWKQVHPGWLDDDNLQEDANQITKEICKVYSDKEHSRMVGELTSLTIEKNGTLLDT